MALIQQVIAQFADTSAWELIAVLLAIAYLLLALRENSLCWYCAFASTAIYTALFWQVSLLMESALNVYYMGMAVYGWYQWRRGGVLHRGVKIRAWPVKNHIAAGAILLLAAWLSGIFLTAYTSAAWPYVDSFVTWGSVLTTWMVAKKVLENWLYWILIDSLALMLYIDRGLNLTALLFFAYLIIVVFGYFSWRKQMESQHADPGARTVGG